MWLWKLRYHAGIMKRIVYRDIPSVFEEGNIIFIHVPKAAGLSLALTLFGQEVGHYPAWMYKSILGKRYDDFFTFSFVRHPVERLISAYYFLKQGGLNHIDLLFKNKVLDKYTSFDEFVLEYLSTKTIYSYIHLFPQTFFVTHHRRIIVSFLGRVENIQEDIHVLEERLNRRIQLPVLNRSNRPLDRLPINDDVVKKIRNLYAEDFALLGYD